MNAALKKEILDSHRLGGSSIDALAKHYGYSQQQIEKLLYPNGRGPKKLAVVIPKQRKVVQTGTLNGVPIVIAEKAHTLRPVVNNIKPSLMQLAVPSQVPVKMQKQDGKKKDPKAVIGALKAWNTMRKREADRLGIPFTPKPIPTIEELMGKQQVSSPPKEERKIEPATVHTPIPPPVVPATEAPQPTLKGTPKNVLGIGNWEDAVAASIAREMWIDDPKTVYVGRIIEEYCRNNDITFKELIEAHRRVLATIGMLCQPLKTLGG